MLLSRSLFPPFPSPVYRLSPCFLISQAIAIPGLERETGPHPKQALGVLSQRVPSRLLSAGQPLGNFPFKMLTNYHRLPNFSARQ